MRLLAVIIISAILGFTLASTKNEITNRMVRQAQRIIGIEFQKSEINTLREYLEENRAGYDSMRMYASNLDNDLAPPLYFDPLPAQFDHAIFTKDNKPNLWTIPSDVDLPENEEALAFYTLGQLSSLIHNEKITSRELTQFFIDRIKKYDSQLLSVITITEDRALERARQMDEELKSGKDRGPLHGIPYGIKDLFTVEGYKTTWGAMPYKNQQFGYDATVVKKLDDAGAVLIAKLTSGALARGDVWFGGKTKNPWDLTEGASGSSAGSGAATSAGLVPFAIGTETLGSIISPSSRNGITGLRPTYGRVSRFGCMPLSWTMDKPGPMARNAYDCAMVFDVIRGADSGDRTTRDVAFDYQSIDDLSSLRIGYLESAFEKDTSRYGKNSEKTLNLFKALGADLIPKSLPENIPYDVFDIILRSEAGAFFDELVRTRGDSTMVQQDKRSRANSLRQSRFIPAVEYLQANRHRAVLIDHFHEVMKDIDVLISPTFGSRQLLITNLTGHPAISIPDGFDSKGRPTSVTIVGNLFDEETILAVASLLQEKGSFGQFRPPNF